MVVLIDEGAGRFGRYLDPETEPARETPEVDFNFVLRQLKRGPAGWRRFLSPIRWMYRGYIKTSAGDLAAAVAYHAIIAMLPMFFLLIAVAGFFLRNDQDVLASALDIINEVFPAGNVGTEAFQQAVDARQNSGWLGLISIVGFAWAGTGFVSSLARNMNRVYGVPGSGYFSEKRRGFVVILLFTLFFTISSILPIVTTFFVNQELPDVLQRFVLASTSGQVIAYGLSYASAVLLFVVIYRILPNAGQRLVDIWPGTLIAAGLFLLVTQAFPIYIRMIGGVGRYGQILGFVTLVVASLYALSHVMLFGAYINAGFQRRLRQRRRERKDRREQREREREAKGAPTTTS